MVGTGTIIDPIISTLCAYMAAACDRTLSDEVSEKGKHHLLDTVAAMVSGARLVPGEMAIKYIATLGGPDEAQVIGTNIRTSVINAAIANGMMAHADETDDSHLRARAHIGCSVVPAALAMAEKKGRSGDALLRAMVLGYDIGARFNLALNLGPISSYSLCTHSHGPGFGAAAAAAALAGLNGANMVNVISLAAEQASGLKTYMRDQDHIGKAFVFGGMPARNGVTAAHMVDTGFTCVPDDITGKDGYLIAFGQDAKPEELSLELGTRFEVMDTNIKKWSVGSPIQAALDSLEDLIREHGITAGDVSAITARLPDDRAFIVDDREMPDINLQHLIAVMLLDGGLTFASSHDEDRMTDPDVLALKKKITLVPETFLTDARPERQAIIEITLPDGQQLEKRTYAVRGTPENPMEAREVIEKAEGLMAPILGSDTTKTVIDTITAIEKLDDTRVLARFFATA
ncbi:MAG: 2-methylcitrate dehydratase PrpD [Alphaproteobacteria bacterium]|jgi:2-methylcitrate dehydratase PrpD